VLLAPLECGSGELGNLLMWNQVLTPPAVRTADCESGARAQVRRDGESRRAFAGSFAVDRLVSG
jgi:hypothetical protein